MTDATSNPIQTPPKAVGGSAWLKPGRQRKPKKDWEGKKVVAIERIRARFGKDKLAELKTTYHDLQASKGFEEADGVIMTCLSMGMSNVEINVFLNVGTSRITRLRKRMLLGADFVKVQHTRSHKFSAETVLFLRQQMKTWKVEDGFPCPHRRARQYFTEEGLTWRKLWQRYKEDVAKLVEPDLKDKVSCMAYSTFTMYVRFINPGLRLTRSEQDVCDSCIRLDLIINNPLSTEMQVANAVMEKQQHNSAARDQRRTISEFTKKYAATLDCSVPDVVIPDHLPEEDADVPARTAESDEEQSLLLIAEDYGQGIALPWFGRRRPGSDYFQSNLMLHMFVVADISKHEHNVFIYDERLMGKDADALCSLRMAFLQRCRRQ